MISYKELKQISISIIVSGFIWLLLFDYEIILKNSFTRTVINIIIVVPGIFLALQSFIFFIQDGNLDRVKKFGLKTKEFWEIFFFTLTAISIGIYIFDRI